MKDKREQQENNKAKDDRLFAYEGFTSWLWRLVIHFLTHCKGAKQEFNNFSDKNHVPPSARYLLKDDQKLTLNMLLSPQKIKISQTVSTSTEQKIDGKKLTANEIDFEEYCCKQFDQEKWLKKNKLNINP